MNPRLSLNDALPALQDQGARAVLPGVNPRLSLNVVGAQDAAETYWPCCRG